MAKKKTTAAKVTISVGTCELFSTMPMVCPLCHITVPANTPHKCERKG